MIGQTKLSEVRAQVRQAFAMSDAELAKWFEKQFANRSQKPKTHKNELETLRLLRDALLKELKSGAPRRKPNRTRVRSKR